MALERATVRPGAAFDPADPTHVQRLLDHVAGRDEFGPGWRLAVYDRATGLAHLERRSATTMLDDTAAAAPDGRTRVLHLGSGYGPNDAKVAAARLEAMPDNAGYVMTDYDPYADRVVLTRLTAEERRCREACAMALRVQPWDVQVQARRGGGFDVRLPAVYSPSAHDAKLEEVATIVVGKPGWYIRVDVPKLRMRIVPAELPTFPPAVPYPEDAAREMAADGRLLFGLTLPDTGDQTGEWVGIDLGATPHFTVNGTTGAGKTSAINSIIRSAMLAGLELAVVDVPHKAVDYTWTKPFVRPSGWGCESLEDSVVVLKLLYEEGEARARTLKRYDVERMSKLPAEVQAQMPPVLIVVDELSGLLQLTDKLLGLPKDHPDRVAATNENALHSMLLNELLKIASQMRFVGLHLCLSTQVANTTTGIPPKLRTLLGGKILLGVNQNEANRRQTFNDESSVPRIPDHIRVDASAGRGVGTMELEGQRPAVFKGVYADVAGHRAAISGMSRPRAGDILPSDEDRRRICSFLYEDADGEPLPQLPDAAPRFSGGPLPGDPDAGAVDGNGNPLRGAAAAHASRKHAEAARADRAPF